MKQQFNLSFPFFAIKSFKANGVQYYPGKLFPVHEMKMSDMKLNALISARKIKQDFSQTLQAYEESLSPDPVEDIMVAKDVLSLPDVLPTPKKGPGRPKKEAD